MRIIATLAIATLAALGMSSQSRAASQSLIGTAYESYSDAANCSNVGLCVVRFLPLPAGKTFLVERVRCRVGSPSAPAYLLFGPTTTTGSSSLLKQTYFEEISRNPVGSYNYLTYEAIPQMMMGGGKYPTVIFLGASPTSMSMECSLAATTLQP